MKKICFVTIGNVYMVPYMKNYSKHINSDYSVIYWDRENLNETDERNKYYRFSYEIKLKDKAKKIIGYLEYRKFIKKIMRENNFDMVIFLQTLSALLMTGYIEKELKNKYIVDVRDYTYETNKIIYSIEKRIVDKSKLCVISSEGYKTFLPQHEYITDHNMRDLPKKKVEEIQNREKTRTVIHIGFVGYVNYQEQHKKLIMALKDDDRFKMSFIGTRAYELKAFCEENNVNNVTLVDTFDTKKTLDYYTDIDLVNNLYGNHTPNLDYALSNKLYFSTELWIPILVCPDTFMESVSKEYGIGMTVDLDSQGFADDIYNYYQNINWKSFVSGCNRFVAKARDDQKRLGECLEVILN
ncbi:Uncharacterised protein [Eubacterium limosum]|uniref:Uncharacterized protein n=1 Tax=Eubacterium limosum TaxID=1736 RepID=A0A6N3HH43_EUBLI